MISFSEGSDNGWQILSISINNKDYLADFVSKSSDDLRDSLKSSSNPINLPELNFSESSNTLDIFA